VARPFFISRLQKFAKKYCIHHVLFPGPSTGLSSSTMIQIQPHFGNHYVIHLYHLLFLAHLGLLGSERIDMMRRQVWRLDVSPV
jgi:hypothetical protein